MSLPLYLFLCYGRSPQAERELRYALEMLRAALHVVPAKAGTHGPDDVANPLDSRLRGNDENPILLYTDRPQAFSDLGVATLDATALLAQARAHAYHHRLKPMVLADALARFRRPCVLLDLDSFAKPGFPARVENALARGAAMNFEVRENPYPDLAPFTTALQNLGAYAYDAKSRMLNSGLIAVRPEHLPLMQDALALIDAIWIKPFHRHDIEQFAIAETLRLGGVEIALIDDVFVHYCARWSRRYMRRRLRRRAPGARIAYSKTRVRLFKAYWTLRLAMRKARLPRGLTWRKT